MSHLGLTRNKDFGNHNRVGLWKILDTVIGRTCFSFMPIYLPVTAIVYLSFLFKFINLIYLFLAALGLCCCTWVFSSCGGQVLLFVAVRGLLIVVASLVAEHGL